MSTATIDEDVVDVPGGRVFVRRWTPAGAVSGVPVVLLHDSLGSVEQWRDFPRALACRLARPVVAYDRLGFGRSSARGELPSVDFIGEEGRVHWPALRRALGIAGHVLLGHSVGGAMALAAAATPDSGCAAVVTLSAQAFVEPLTLAGIRAARARFEDPEQFGRLTRWHGDKARWVLDAWTRVWLSPAFAGWSLEPGLGDVRCPVLAVHGDQDDYGSVEFPRRIVGGVRGPARLAILERCGHLPHREQPERVLDLLAGFTTGLAV